LVRLIHQERGRWRCQKQKNHAWLSLVAGRVRSRVPLPAESEHICTAGVKSLDSNYWHRSSSPVSLFGAELRHLILPWTETIFIFFLLLVLTCVVISIHQTNTH
jgi:hypothetical protein